MGESQAEVVAVPGAAVLVRGWAHGNSVLLSDAVIDTGYHTGADALLSAWRDLHHPGEEGPVPQRVLLTHAHSDHAGGAARLAALGARISAHPEVAALVARWDTEGLWLGPQTGQTMPPFRVDVPLAPGGEVVAGGQRWRVLEAGGHARGGVAFFCAETGVLVTGDALWEDGFGVLVPWFDGPGVYARTAQALSTLEALAAEAAVVVVVPGHGRPFADLSGALARARRRLDGIRADPARLRQQVLRNLAGFRSQVEPTLSAEAVQDWLREVVPQLPPLPGDRAMVPDALLVAEVMVSLVQQQQRQRQRQRG